MTHKYSKISVILSAVTNHKPPEMMIIDILILYQIPSMSAASKDRSLEITWNCKIKFKSISEILNRGHRSIKLVLLKKIHLLTSQLQ